MKNIQQPRLHVVPLSWKSACAFVAQHHRHHKPPRGQKFAIGAVDEATGQLLGVATCGRPVARHYDDSLTLEVNRTCTDGSPNVNSFLYNACWKVASAMGYSRLLTYTEESESGVSLRAAGWQEEATRPRRKNWAESSVKMRDLRDPDGRGGVARKLWTKQEAA